MTKNAFIFVWDIYGIEGIIPITQYENHEKENLIRMLKDQPIQRSPLDNIMRNIILRAKFNTQRHYEIYAIDCDQSLDEKFWRKQWTNYPQETAELIRDKGQKIYSDRSSAKAVIV